MNLAVFQAARQAGCSTRQAEILATYVTCETTADAARELRISEQTVKNHLAAIRRRFDVAHTAGAVAMLVGEPISTKNQPESTYHQ